MAAVQETDDLGKAPLIQENRWTNTKTGQEGRHHVHESILQRAVKEAVRRPQAVKHVGYHT